MHFILLNFYTFKPLYFPEIINKYSYMTRLLLSLILLTSILPVFGQQAAAIDSMRLAVSHAKTTEGKAYWMDMLARTLMSVDLAQSEKAGQELIELAEESRDRKLMIFAYRSSAIRYSYYGGQKEYTEKSISYYNKALNIARDNKLDAETGGILLRLANVYLMVPDKDKALGYANQGASIISTLNNDSLQVETENTFGQVYLFRNERILALRHYLTALRLAESLKESSDDARSRKNEILRKCYMHLSTFYTAIEAYDKAIDNALLAYKTLDNIREKNVPYQRAIDLNGIGNLHAYNNNPELAMQYFRRSIALADTLHFTNLKVPGYTSLLNQYLRINQPGKALEFMESAEGKSLQDFMRNFGMASIIDQAYGVVYTENGKYDSARVRLQRAVPYFENQANDNNRIYFYTQQARFYTRTGQFQEAISTYQKMKELSDKIGEIKMATLAAQMLDSLYGVTGNYQQAMKYNSLYHLYKDSSAKLSREKEITQVEAADEQLRQARIEREQLEAKRKRYNIQYLAITVGIAGVFIVMVMLGMFKVSATTIKLVGFFAFLMFFEFIFLILKKNIAGITQGEPWKDLLFMIGLAALLLPLHHWLEHKVIHYLTSHNRLTSSGKGLLNRLKGNRNLPSGGDQHS
jgi:tetratricopeptide (TPR) repeat protein